LIEQPTRLEQLGNLLTAMIAVIVSGNSGVLLDQPIYSIHPEFSGIDLRDFGARRPYYGVKRRVALKLGMSEGSVGRVINGGAGSARVKAAVLDEISRCDSAGTKSRTDSDPLGLDVLKHFGRGGKYYGVFAHVGRRLGLTSTTVCSGCRHGGSKRILDAVRDEMARIDAGNISSPLPIVVNPIHPLFISPRRGLFSELAKALRVDQRFLRRVAMGTKGSRPLKKRLLRYINSHPEIGGGAA
jgi:hypothetical protein